MYGIVTCSSEGVNVPLHSITMSLSFRIAIADSKRCLRRRSHKPTPPNMRPRPAPTVGIDLNTLCIRQKRTTYLVYKAITDTEMMFAFDDIKAATVDIYKWSVIKGKES